MKNKFLLKVSSGKFKGKGIVSPENYDIRPTSGRVKDSLFNIIRTDLYGSDFLDLFGGTGQMAIEASSNGARECVLADKDLTLARTNVKLVGCGNISLVKGDFKDVLLNFGKNGRKFDFIFADPPYNDGFYDDIMKYALPVLSENGTLILEHASDMTVSKCSDAIKKDERTYGSRTLTFIGAAK